MMILVTGATGNIGSELVPMLLTKGAAVRVISRDPGKAARLDSCVERVMGDLHEPSVIEQAKPIRCVDIPIAAAMERMKANGLPESLAESLANVWTRILEGRGTFQTDEVEKVTGKPAQKFESWCRQHHGAFV